MWSKTRKVRCNTSHTHRVIPLTVCPIVQKISQAVQITTALKPSLGWGAATEQFSASAEQERRAAKSVWEEPFLRASLISPCHISPSPLPGSDRPYRQDKKKVKDLRDAFNFFDLDGGGSIGYNELSTLLSGLGVQCTPEEARDLLMEAPPHSQSQHKRPHYPPQSTLQPYDAARLDTTWGGRWMSMAAER